uniref:(northern house mosquito) hypothetical protein n=1 Tax=Culex pipiens TaxID=7175 RepID=A0A8D8FA61_CULPI
MFLIRQIKLSNISTLEIISPFLEKMHFQPTFTRPYISSTIHKKRWCPLNLTDSSLQQNKFHLHRVFKRKFPFAKHFALHFETTRKNRGKFCLVLTILEVCILYIQLITNEGFPRG